MSCTRHTEHAIRGAAMVGRYFPAPDGHFQDEGVWEVCDDGGAAPQPVDDDCTCRGEWCPIHRPEPTWEEKHDVLEQRIEEALVLLDRTAVKVFRTSQVGQLVEQIGCRLTGRKGSWHPGDR